MSWKTYAVAMLLFNAIGLLLVYLCSASKTVLPLNQAHAVSTTPMTAESAFNTAVSFATNTNWQGYGGETDDELLHADAGARACRTSCRRASGMAVLVALIRGFARRQTDALGNFWVDMTRSTLYVLLPLSAAAGAGAGVAGRGADLRAESRAWRWSSRVTVRRSGCGADHREQVLPLGPAASQIAIKQLGTNGGGFFNVNSAHPFENPTPLSNFLEVLAILLIPAALCYTFGRMVRDTRQGWAVLVAMLMIFRAAHIRACYRGRAVRQSVAATHWAWISRHPSCSPAATWKARKCASASPTPRCGLRPRRRPPTVP